MTLKDLLNGDKKPTKLFKVNVLEVLHERYAIIHDDTAEALFRIEDSYFRTIIQDKGLIIPRPKLDGPLVVSLMKKDVLPQMTKKLELKEVENKTLTSLRNLANKLSKSDKVSTLKLEKSDKISSLKLENSKTFKEFLDSKKGCFRGMVCFISSVSAEQDGEHGSYKIANLVDKVGAKAVVFLNEGQFSSLSLHKIYILNMIYKGKNNKDSENIMTLKITKNTEFQVIDNENILEHFKRVKIASNQVAGVVETFFDIRIFETEEDGITKFKLTLSVELLKEDTSGDTNDENDNDEVDADEENQVKGAKGGINENKKSEDINIDITVGIFSVNGTVLRLIKNLNFPDEVSEEDVAEKMESLLGEKCLLDYSIYNGVNHIKRIQVIN